MWINNGNEISKIYAGTGAIQGGSKVNMQFIIQTNLISVNLNCNFS